MNNIYSQLFETAMVISFGISWPLSIIKSYKSRTTKGKSIIFLYFILFGYISGVASKIFSSNITYVFVFYVINLIMVFIDLCLYYRNYKLDKKRICIESNETTAVSIQ
jgi:lipopolysaccharide export LptBFGC system permease protein LptF